MSEDILKQLGLEPSSSQSEKTNESIDKFTDKALVKKDPIVQVKEATFAYGRNVILESVEMQIHDSEFWCFIGPNGEGKTTLIKVVFPSPLGPIKHQNSLS